MKQIKIIVIATISIVFVLGLYLYASKRLDNLFFPIEGMENGVDASGNVSNNGESSCPDLLIRRGNVLLLYNSKIDIVDGFNPLPFYNLDEYINYLTIERKKGRNCPVLFLQHETTTQGDDVYRMRPNPFEMDAGLSTISADAMAKPPTQIPLPVIDANRDHPPYNAGNYAGFDSHGLSIGVFTKLDEIHNSTQNQDGQSLSDNPMDPNWGGVLYTQQKIVSGKYDDNNITKPHYNTPHNTIFIPGLFGHTPPPNEFPSDDN